MRKIIVLCYFLVSFPCETIFQSQCNRLEFLCKNGACVELINVCDGVENCQDGSDETAERCSSIYCPAYAFRCAYGACVEANAVCDGTEDCADGSDESPLRCGVGHTGATTNANNNPQRLPVSGDSGAPNGGCIFDSLANVIAHYESSQNEALKPGETVADFSSITYKCQPKQVLVGSADNFCDNGKWRNQHPTCTKYCDSSVITGVTIQASCEYNNVGIPCHASVLLPGTRATISCQIGYQKPDRIVQEILVCGRNGEWDYHPFRCEQVCGVEPPISTPFVVGGATINNTFVPWHVGIYYNGDGKYDQMCGGTIVNAKVVVSAAHCFWDARQENVHDKSHYAVAAGKYYRSYYATEPLPAQFFRVAELFVPSGYKDANLAYTNDIAIVVLTDYIVFKPHIKPICIEWQSFSNLSIRSNLIGRIAGWGKTDDSLPSEELKAVDLPAISYEQCIEKLEPQYKNALTGDKFCVGKIPGEAVCQGDSGGGFALSKIVGGQKVFFLWGIVSNGLTRGECSGDYYTAFTNIQFYQMPIIHFESQNRPP